METDKIPPHLSAEEHLLHLTEEQLIKDGRQWLKRAADLYTQTPKIKIWVPVLASCLITSYYMYTIHASSAATASMNTSAVSSAPVAVADNTPSPQSLPLPAAVPVPGPATSASTPDAPDSDADLVQRAQQAHASQQFAEEAGLLQKVLDHSKWPQQACPNIAKAYERAAQIDLSIHAYERCLGLTAGNADTLISFAHALQAKPDFKRAAAIYRQCLQIDPANLDAQTGLALVELRQNHLREADEAAELILQRAPDNTDALLITGIAAWRQSRIADAEKIFSKGVELDDRRADFHSFLGRVAEAQRRPQEALQQYEKALALDPSDTEIAERRDRLRGSR